MGLSGGPRAVSGVSATGHLLLPLIPHDPENSSVSSPPQRRQARVARPQALTPGSDPKGFLEMLAWKCLVMQGRFPSRRHMTIGPTWFLVCDPRKHYTPKFTVGQREAKGLAREAGISESAKPHPRPKIEDQRDEEGLHQSKRTVTATLLTPLSPAAFLPFSCLSVVLLTSASPAPGKCDLPAV